MRRHLSFDCQGDKLVGTLDQASGKTGLLIVSGGNEVRAGAHRGQAMLAAQLAHHNIPVLRYDRRGIGDSEGSNQGFQNSADDIAAALACFRTEAGIDHVVAFGNCDAATALAIHKFPKAPDALILSNPWVIEEGAASHSPRQLRQRYWGKLRSPRALWQFLNSDLNVKKLGTGLKTAASTKAPASNLAEQMAAGLKHYSGNVFILLARRDRTAQQFSECLRVPALASLITSPRYHIRKYDSASHSYAGEADQNWLIEQLIGAARTIERTC